jgi:hypothetical protein
MRHFQHWRTVAAGCCARLALSPIMMGGEGGNQADEEGLAKLGDGFAVLE